MAKNCADVLIEGIENIMIGSGVPQWNHIGRTYSWQAGASKRFWADAKQNILNVIDFHRSYDDDLNDLGLFEGTFDDDTGLMKSKAIYGKFKNADQNSWAVKAAIKFWALQFSTNAKTRKEIEAEEKRQYRADIDALYDEATKSVTAELVEAQLKDITLADLGFTDVLKLRAEYINLDVQEKEIEQDLGYSLSTDTDIDSAVDEEISGYFVEDIRADIHREGYYRNWFADFTVVAQNDNSIKERISVYLNSDDLVELRKTNTLSDESKQTIIRYIKHATDTKIHKYTEDIDSKKHYIGVLSTRKNDHDARTSINKDIIDAVSQGHQPSKEVVDKIIEIARTAKAKARKEEASWASWSGDDGDSGAAYAGEIEHGADLLEDCLKDLYWTSDAGDWAGGTTKEFETALKDLVENNVSTINFSLAAKSYN